MKRPNDACRFAEAIIRECGADALGVVQSRIRLLESEQRHAAAQLWREIAEAIETLQADT
jgi:hypothetical protein